VEFGLRASCDVFTPGVTERTVLPFEAAADAGTLRLSSAHVG
jgi:hypothetical protein